MGFDDIAQRMKSQRRVTRRERLRALWTGEEPELQLPDPVEPVAPAHRRRHTVAAWLVMFLGVGIAVGGAALVWLLESRALIVVVAIGIAVIVQATRMFDAVAATAPLPDARLRR